MHVIHTPPEARRMPSLGPAPAAPMLRAMPRSGRLPVERLRLGMPHLGGGGTLSEGWLMRRAGHLHWQSIAGSTGVPIAALRDAGGHRALPSIVSARLSGAADAFAEDDEALVTQSRPPSAATGWRSRMLVRRTGGPTVRLDLVSRFARRAGPSNRDLTRAEMPEDMRAAPPDRLPPDARVLRARWAALRAGASDAPPHVTVPVGRWHLNGVGLLYFANFVRFFATAEAAATAPVPLPALRSREVHWYGNADVGDALDLSVETTVTDLGPRPAVTTLSHACRRSDGALVAVCEARRGGG